MAATFAAVMHPKPTMRQRFRSVLAPTSPIPLALEVAFAEGPYIYDQEGVAYLDLISGIGVSNIGHSHPEVLEAIHCQADQYLHTMVYGEYLQSPQVQFAEVLIETLPEGLNCVYFTNSGAEAIEGAMKLAKRISRRGQFVSCANSYHGSTQGALSIAGSEGLKQAFRPLIPGNIQIAYNDFDHLGRIGEDCAAVFVEPVAAEAGIIPADKDWLLALRRRCDEVGALLVFDEIQTGMGRTGILWAFERSGVQPDILAVGKALGGGLPLGAFIAKREHMALLSHDPALGHITTFGGHPLSCAAGLAAFQVINREKLWKEAERKEKRIKELFAKHGRECRGQGLLLALQTESFQQVQGIIAQAYENKILTDWFLFNDTCVRIAPPLNIDNKVLEAAVEALAGK